MAESKFPTYWCTRDADASGVLAEMIDVWLVRPSRLSAENGSVVWADGSLTGIESRYAQWTEATTYQNCRVMPETSRECIRVGEE